MRCINRCLITFILFWGISNILHAKSILKGAVYFLNSGSRPAVGVKISAFGANDCYSTSSGMFTLEFSDKKPGDRIRIIIGSTDGEGRVLELVNDKVIANLRIPAKPNDDIIEVIVCPAGKRNEAAISYNGIIVKAINENSDKQLQEINKKLSAAKIDAETIISLQHEKEKLIAERDSAITKSEELALFIASINLDKASKLVKEAVMKIDSLNDISGAIVVLDSEMLYEIYLEASNKRKKAEIEIKQVLSGFELKVRLLEPLYRYAEIAQCYEKMAEIHYNNGNYDEEKQADNLTRAGYFWGVSGYYQKQLEFNQKALAIREKILPPDHPDLALSLNNLAAAYGHLGDHQKQLELNQRALAIREKILPPDHPDLAMSLNNLAATYNEFGEYQKALELNQKALAIREKTLPPDHLDLTMSNNNIAWTYGKLGEYLKQVEFDYKVLATREKVLPPDHPYLASSFNNLAAAYSNLGDYQKQIEFNQKALAIREKILPANHPDLATTYHNTAAAYSSLGNHKKQLEFNLKAMSILEKILPDGHPDLAKSYENVAVSYSYIGEHQKALEFSLLSLTILEKALPADSLDLAMLYQNIGWIYSNLGNYQKLLEFDLKSMTIKEKKLSSEHPQLAKSYSGVGFAYGKLGEYQKEIEFDLKALAIQEKNLPKEHPDLAQSYNNIAWVYGELGDYQKQLEFNLKALAIREKILPPDHPILELTYNNVGYNYAKLRLLPQAKIYFEKCHLINPSGRSFRNWAMYYALNKDNVLAIENLKKAVELGYNNLKWITSDDSLESIRNEEEYKNIVKQLIGK